MAAALSMDVESGAAPDLHSTGYCRDRYTINAGQRDISQLAFDLSLVSRCAKIYALNITGSKVVAASLADSGVDILSQAVLALSKHYMHKKHEDFPVGRHRLESLGVIACSCIMSIAAIEVIQSSIEDLVQGFGDNNPPTIEVNLGFYLILGGGIAAKLLLWQLCKRATPSSDSLDALAADHRNDVASNTVAVATA
eukprot:1139-Heterococcus_DN1.PRE.1